MTSSFINLNQVGSFVANNSLFQNFNSSSIIYSSSSNIQIESSTFFNCTTSAPNTHGGILNAQSSPVTIINSNFSYISSYVGAVAYGFQSPLTVISSTFMRCIASFGGTFYVDTSKIVFDSSTFSYCTASQFGSVFNGDGSALNMTD
jgi:hypothetical protein